MNVRNLPNRLEITFWSIVIFLLTEIPALGRLIRPVQEVWNRLVTPRILKRAVALWIALCAAGLLILGFLVWRATFGAPEEAPAYTAGEMPGSSGTAGSPQVYPANGQRNLLVIGVDDLQAQDPELESVWLILFVENSPQLTLLPVYPTGPAEKLFGKRGSLAGSFQLSPERTPGAAFLEALKSRDLWWTGYVLLDRSAMTSIVEFFEAGTGEGEPSAAVDEIPSPRKDLLGALAGQAMLAQELCARSRGLSPSPDTARLIELIPQHLVTDLDPEQALLEWGSLLRNGSGFSCELPTLPALLSGAP